jgi:thiol:disulfide interchange protein
MGGFGLMEIVMVLALLFGAGAVVFGLVLIGWKRQQPLASGESPSLPAKPAAAPAASHLIVHVRAGAPLSALLREHANTAELAKLRPFLEFGASWCPPSRLFGDALEDPRMRAALSGVYLIRADIDEFGDDPYARELRAVSVPVFYELNAEGRWTGRTINGGAWGADTIENMSRTMSGFFAG